MRNRAAIRAATVTLPLLVVLATLLLGCDTIADRTGLSRSLRSSGQSEVASCTSCTPCPDQPAAATVVSPSPTLTVESSRPERSTLVVGNTGGDGVFIRRTPAKADKIKAWPDGTRMVVVGEDRSAEGITWRKVEAPDGTVGWVPAEYLVNEVNAGQTKSVRAVPKATPSAMTAAPTQSPTVALPKTPTAASPGTSVTPTPGQSSNGSDFESASQGLQSGLSRGFSDLANRLGALIR